MQPMSTLQFSTAECDKKCTNNLLQLLVVLHNHDTFWRVPLSRYSESVLNAINDQSLVVHKTVLLNC